jgi:hypothetical protein
MKEHWKIIAGFEAYEVSDLGRVRRRLPGNSSQAVVGKLLKPSPNSRGYLQVALYRDRKPYYPYVHRLVAQAFLPNPKGLPEVNHKGKLSDCRAVKLEWKSKEGHRIDVILRSQRGDGVQFDAERGMWKTYYRPSAGKTKFLGHFSTKKEALTARTRAYKNLQHVV